MDEVLLVFLSDATASGAVIKKGVLYDEHPKNNCKLRESELC